MTPSVRLLGSFVTFMAPPVALSPSPSSPPPSLFFITVSPPLRPSISHLRSRRQPSPTLLCRSSKKKQTSLADQILDYIEGGPKLRKWYGAPELLPKDGASEAEEEDGYEEIEEVRDAVLVTDGESEIGQMVILALILKRARVKALVKDKRSAVEAFGTYVESMVGDISDRSFLRKALRGVRAIVSPSNDGFFSNIGQMKDVQHIVLLSQLAVYRGSSGIQAIINNKLRKLAEKDEEVVIASGIPYTIIRAGLLQNSPGGTQGFCFDKGIAGKGKLSKEDAATICVEALEAVPKRGVDLEVVNGEEKISDWKEWFAVLIENNERLR